ncbi:MAG: cytochrome c biogenesis protein CcsA, partial [Gammaproteobacteria bacterium]|nr:cytochrome c biogenesis protein CcsA [Gammaproteobacteria bacterium]
NISGHSDSQLPPFSAPILGLTIAIFAFALHTGALWQALNVGKGLRLGLPNVAGLLAWQVALFALLAATRPALRGLGALLLPLAGLAAFLSLTDMPSPGSDHPGWQVQSHVVLSLLSYGLFTMAALLALLMRAQEKSIRRGSPGRFLRLMPPLESADQALFACIGAGFALLSLAIFSGLIFVENLLAQHLVHKTVLSLLGWLVYGMLLVGRWRFGWRGETAAGWTLAGFALLFLAYFGSGIVLELILGRQWS